MPPKKKKKLKILFAASEAVPFAKCGGLADVCGGLPKALKKMGHDVRLVLPRYWCIDREKYGFKKILSPVGVSMGNTTVWCEILEGKSDGFPVYFVEHENYFGRSGLYNDGQREYWDNGERFGFFSRAAIQICRDINFQPDIIHCHDWQTALIAAYLKTWEFHDPFFAKTASVLTIHNLAHQGKFSAGFYPFLGLGADNFVQERFEDFGMINFAKGAIFFADAINTVSPSHAVEILSEPGGNGLSTYLGRRHEDVCGILNGADYDRWNPNTDELIPAKYSASDLSGKALCRKELQKEFMLDPYERIPIIGIISRFYSQKGFQLLVPVIKMIVRDMAVQFAIIGSGEKWLEDFFGGLPAELPGKIGAWIGYNEHKAHLIEAGSDLFLMPSLYEPCGLNQIYSLKYGTLPIVRDTGGLRDTVEQYNEATGCGTGFIFQAPDPMSIYYTVGWAVSTYFDRPQHFQGMRVEAMKRSFTWEDSAKKYETIYEKALWRRSQWT